MERATLFLTIQKKKEYELIWPVRNDAGMSGQSRRSRKYQSQILFEISFSTIQQSYRDAKPSLQTFSFFAHEIPSLLKTNSKKNFETLKIRVFWTFCTLFVNFKTKIQLLPKCSVDWEMTKFMPISIKESVTKYWLITILRWRYINFFTFQLETIL